MTNKKMKTTKLLTLCIAILIAAGCREDYSNKYVLTATVEGLPDGTQMKLTPVSHDDEKPIADTIAIGNKFVFKGAMEEARLVRLTADGMYGAYLFMLENGKLNLTGRAVIDKQGEYTNCKFTDMKMTGSPLTEAYLQKISVRDSLNKKHAALLERNEEISRLLGEARRDKDQGKMDSLMKTDAYKQLAVEERDFFDGVRQSYERVILDNKDSFWGPLLMLNLMTYLTKEQIPWYEAMSEEAKDSYYGKLVKAELLPEGFVGKPLPAFTLTGKDSKEVSIAEIGAGKKCVLVDFWASWCAPCRREIPNLKKLYEKYSSKGFEIIGISWDKKEADWEKAIKDEQLTWPHYLNTNGASDSCRVKAIPAMFLIDDTGVVIAENIRGEELADKLKEIFGI
jgi:peroxiredoxin